MQKNFLMRADGVGAIHENIKASKLHFDIKDCAVTLLRSDYPDFLAALILGLIVPHSGNIYLAGVNITERNVNERRVALMPSELSPNNIKSMLTASLTSGIDNPTVYENKRADLQSKIHEYRASAKSEKDKRDEFEKKIKQAQIDFTATGLKMKRRQSELELNLKATKSLLSDLKKSGSESYIPKMEAKYFSAQYEYALYMHKKLSQSVIDDRINRTVNDLRLTNDVDELTRAFACAYVKAPVLIVYRSDFCDMSILDELCEYTGISICVCADKSSKLDCKNIIDIPSTYFKRTDEVSKN